MYTFLRVYDFFRRFFGLMGWLIDRINDVEKGGIRGGEDGNESGAFRWEERGMERMEKKR